MDLPVARNLLHHAKTTPRSALILALAAAVAAAEDEHPKAKGTEFESPPYTPAVMREFYDRYVPAITLERYTPGRLGITSEPMRLSDHAPVVGAWELPR